MLHYEKLCRGGANKVNHSLVNSVLTQPTLRYYELIQLFIGTSPAFSCAVCWLYDVLHKALGNLGVCSQATATKTFKIDFYASISSQLFNRLIFEFVTWAKCP